MKVTLLGTGTSGGVPALGCHCEVCRSKDPRDHRLRSAALVETESTRILIDAGPDIREQLLKVPFKKIDALLITHIHYDHIGGLDDLRPFSHHFDGLDVYCEKFVDEHLHHTMPYCFPSTPSKLYPGAPVLRIHTIKPHEAFRVGDIDILPIRVMHDNMPIVGFRFGPFVYITDMKRMDDEEYDYLQNVDTLVINALRWEKPHHSHQLVADAIDASRRMKARRTYLTHLTHKIGLHAIADRRLPPGVQLGYDGLVLDV
jgi:phosphoribosyl 1,2-cyclic phosphate phosphodiesterase